MRLSWPPRDALPASRSRRLLAASLRVAWPALVCGLAALTVATGYGVARLAPPLPPPAMATTLFRGVRYQRIVSRHPLPQVLHLVLVDLETPGLELVGTPAEPSGALRARTTSEFLQETGASLAVNGDAFEPWYSHTPWDFYPHSGDVVRPLGRYATASVLHPALRPLPPRPTLRVGPDGRATLDGPAAPVRVAVSGLGVLVRAGRAVLAPRYRSQHRHPRTALGLDRSRRTLLLLVADGRQRGYAAGLTEDELAQRLLAAGAHDAINLDGGGSSALVVRGPRGGPALLSSPIHTRVPGRERPVANHLGVRGGVSRAKLLGSVSGNTSR